MTADFEYGNTRLRAMRTRLMGDADYQDLLDATTIEQLIGKLDETEYEEDIEAAVTRYFGAERFHRAVSANLARTLTKIRGFYAGDAARQVDVLLSHYDADNLVTILRAQAAPPGAVTSPHMLVPAGTLSLASLDELASQDGLRATVELMGAWGLPTPGSSSKLLDAWKVFSQTGDLTDLETTVAVAYAGKDATTTADLPSNLAGELAARIDATNLLAALRLGRVRRDATIAPENAAYLPGGKLTTDLLDRIAAAASADVPGLLAAAPVPPGWADALERWSEHDQLDVLADELDASRRRRAVGLFAAGDPLSIDIPIAYVAAKETEVRNLRLIGAAIVHGIPAPDIAERLVSA